MSAGSAIASLAGSAAKSTPWGAIASGVGSALGGLFSSGSARYAARKQLQAVQETNQANRDIAAQNNEYNYRMFTEQNEWNSAVNQRKRLEEAGLNPNLMMNGGSAGIASSAPTADTSGTQVAPDIGSTLTQGGIAAGSAIASSANVIADLLFKQELQDAQVDKAHAETQGQQLENLYNLNTLEDRTKLKHTELSAADLSFAIAQQLKDEHIKQGQQQTKLMQAQTAAQNAAANYQESMAALNDIEIQWLPAKNAAEIKKIISESFLNSANAGLSFEKAKTEASIRVRNYADANKLKVEAMHLPALMDSQKTWYDKSGNNQQAQAGFFYARTDEVRAMLPQEISNAQVDRICKIWNQANGSIKVLVDGISQFLPGKLIGTVVEQFTKRTYDGPSTITTTKPYYVQ